MSISVLLSSSSLALPALVAAASSPCSISLLLSFSALYIPYSVVPLYMLPNWVQKFPFSVRIAHRLLPYLLCLQITHHQLLPKHHVPLHCISCHFCYLFLFELDECKPLRSCCLPINPLTYLRTPAHLNPSNFPKLREKTSELFLEKTIR